MGYTTVFEPANPPLKMLHVHEELNDTPIVDKGAYPVFGNNWFVMDYLAQGKLDECAAYLAWALRSVKGYAIKLVDPGSVEEWKWGGRIDDLDTQVPRFGVTPREIIQGLCKVNHILKLPHTIHVHANMLGTPGNMQVTLQALDAVKNLANDGPCVHLAHAQFSSYRGRDWPSMASGAEELARYVNKHRHVTLDLGQIIFTDTTTMTADGPFEYQLHLLSNAKWINSDTEAETGTGIVPIRYRKRNYVHAVMWAIGLEIALMIKNRWALALTTDHPNGGPFRYYPRVISWLMSANSRRKVLAQVPRMSRVRSTLDSIDDEYTWNDVAIVTRAAPAKMLGLGNKGHLGIGADGDVSIYPLDPSSVNPSTQPQLVEKALSTAYLTVKKGEVVVREGKVVSTPGGDTLWVDSKVATDLQESVEKDVSERFREYYTVEFGNYIIPETTLAGSHRIATSSRS
jgi:formylmethanofuran dehydrogenase subunit A